MNLEPRTTTAANLRAFWPNLRLVFSVAWRAAPWELSGFLLTSAIGAVSPIAMSLTLRWGIDTLNLQVGRGTTAIPLIVLLVLVARAVVHSLNDLIYWILGGQVFERRVYFKVQNALALQFNAHVAGLDIGHLEDSATQNLIMKARDGLSWRPLNMLESLVRMLNSAVTIVGAVALLLPFGWWVPLLLVVTTLPRLVLRLRYSGLSWGAYNSSIPSARRLWYYRYLLTDVDPIRETRISGAQPALLKRVDALQQEVTREQLAVLNRAAFAYVLPVLVETGALFAVGVASVPDVLVGLTTVGSFTLLLGLSEQLSGSVSGVLMNASDMLEASLYVTDIRQVFDLPRLLPLPATPRRLATGGRPPRIEFRDVRFAYPGGAEVIRGVSFTIEPGQRVALVGANGAGKSTLVKLLCRFYDVTGGAVLVDGIDVRELDLADWYRHLGTLFQEFERFRFTVRESIQLGAADVDDDARVRAAARMSGASEFIDRFPLGYDAPLGRDFDGEELSAGQWQKLSIARAFYRSAPVLILDEPTSAIDAVAEEEIFQSLERLYAAKTLLLISHRFSTVRGADMIVVLEDGAVGERGTHAELIARGGTYARMFTAQAKGYV